MERTGGTTDGRADVIPFFAFSPLGLSPFRPFAFSPSIFLSVTPSRSPNA